MKKLFTTLFCLLAVGVAFAFAGGAKEKKSDAMMAPDPKAGSAPNAMMAEDPKKDGAMMAEDPMKKDDAMMAEDPKKDGAMMAEDPMKKEETMMKQDSMMVDPAKAVFDLRGLQPAVLPYEGEAAAQRLAADKRVVYFFAASWCPTCKATYEDLKVSAMKAPKDLAIVVVDYDKETDLKAKYGITYQHTYVAIGPMGEKRSIWSGSTKLSEIAMKTPKK